MYQEIFIVLCAIGGYLLGSVTFGLVFTKMVGIDLRKVGPGTIGATNVLRTGRKDLALLTLICDSGKAALAAYIAMLIAPDEISDLAGLTAGTFGVIGHNFPVWLKFKGGKGVAATLGMLLVTCPFVGVLTCATWLAVAGMFRYSSLAALIALVAAPIYALFLELPPEFPCFYGFLAVLAIIRHQSNIRRLIKGEESKIGKKKADNKKEDKKEEGK